MKKLVIISLAAAMTLLVACGQNKATPKEEVRASVTGDEPTKGDEPAPTPTPNPEVNPTPVAEPIVAPKPNAIIDPADPVKAEELDAKVREEAKKANVPENEYRLLIEKKEDGTQIYRMIGKYVIVNPDGTEDLVPDQR